MKFNTWYWDKDRSRFVFVIDYEKSGSYCGWIKTRATYTQFWDLFAHPKDWVYDIEEKEPSDSFGVKKSIMIRDVFTRLTNEL